MLGESAVFKTSGLRLLAVLLLGLALAGGLNEKAHAVIVNIDPGNVGEVFTDRTFVFDELNGQVADGSTVPLDFVFSPKSLEADGRFIAYMELTWSAPVDIVALASGTLTDESGNAIAGTISRGLGGLSLNETFHALTFRTDESFHGISVSLVLPSGDGAELVGAFVRLFRDVPPGSGLETSFTVGGPTALPEPSTVALLGFGALGLGLLGARRRQRIAISRQSIRA